MDEILLDYRTRSLTPVAGFQLVRRNVQVAGRSRWGSLEANAEAEFWENRRLLEQGLERFPRYLFDRSGFWACAILRSFLVARGADTQLDFLVPNDSSPSAPIRERFRLFGGAPTLPNNLAVFDLSDAPLTLAGLRLIACPVPPLIPGLRVETAAWALMEQLLDTAKRDGLGHFAVWFGIDAIEAASLLRVSRQLNDGRPARIYIRDGLGSVRELEVWNRWDESERRKRLHA